jgi:uncharacterized membrane protein YjjP (DUF1212 family)
LTALGIWATAAFIFIRAIPPLNAAGAILLYIAVATFTQQGPWLGSLVAFLASIVYIALLSILTAKIN